MLLADTVLVFECEAIRPNKERSSIWNMCKLYPTFWSVTNWLRWPATSFRHLSKHRWICPIDWCPNHDHLCSKFLRLENVPKFYHLADVFAYNAMAHWILSKVSWPCAVASINLQRASRQCLVCVCLLRIQLFSHLSSGIIESGVRDFIISSIEEWPDATLFR